jgi:DNA-binding winged helix-turn-helix (wHTH) protein/Tol biopolymer transport system component
MNKTSQTAVFGPYELNVRSGELRKFGTRLKMGEQAFQILCMLLETPGEMVTREQLRTRLWPQDTFVDFDHGLNSAMQRLRDCLSDSAVNPRWIETIPRRGYRFVGQVDWVEQDSVSKQRSPANGNGLPRYVNSDVISNGAIQPERPVHKRGVWWAVAVAAMLVLAAIVAVREMSAVAEPRVVHFRKLTNTPGHKYCPYAAGNTVYFNEQDDLDTPNRLMQVSTSGGEPLAIPTPFAEPLLSDVSRDGSKLLLAIGDSMQKQLWILPVPGGSPRRVGDVLAQDAAFSADATKILYSNGNGLYLVGADGSTDRKLLNADGFVDSPEWSPDGMRVRYRVTPAYSHNGVFWEAGIDGSNPHALFSGAGGLCCGVWSSNGRYFVYYSRREGEEGFWAVREKTHWFQRAESKPVLLAATTLLQVCGVASRSSAGQIFATGEQPQAELMSYNPQSKQFDQALGGLSAEYFSVSPNREWIAYVTFPEGEVWRARVDGSERVKLTGATHALNTHWSPDSKSISFVTRQPGGALYRISVDGGTAERLPSGNAPVLSNAWSPDGRQMVIGEWIGTQAPVLRILDMASKHLSEVPGSEGMLFPAWSPDGHYIAASVLEGAHKGGWLYAVDTHQWSSIPSLGPSVWSHDSQYLFYEDRSGNEAKLERVRVPKGAPEEVVSLKGMHRAKNAPGGWFGLDENDAPILLRDTGTVQLYALDWQSP